MGSQLKCHCGQVFYSPDKFLRHKQAAPCRSWYLASLQNGIANFQMIVAYYKRELDDALAGLRDCQAELAELEGKPIPESVGRRPSDDVDEE